MFGDKKIIAKTLYKDKEVQVKPRILRNGRLVDANLLTYIEPRLSVEMGAYASISGDPSNSMMLHFMTADSTPVECQYRKEGTSTWLDVPLYADKPFPNTETRVRWFKLDGLEPDTFYEAKLKYHDRIHRFKTFPAENSDVTLALLSDMMNSQNDFKNEAPKGFNIFAQHEADAIVVAGDFVHDNGHNAPAWTLFWQEYFRFEQAYGRMIPFIVCLGNHDGASFDENNNRQLLWYTFPESTKEAVTFMYNFFAGLSDTGYGAVDVGNVVDVGGYFSFVYLNSFHTAPVLGEQTTWLETVLSERQDRHVFPFFHVPPYPAYYNYNSNPFKDIREQWTPLFTQYGIRFVYSGHDHVNLVTKKVTGGSLDENGAIYVIQHGLGNNTRGINIEPDEWFVDFLDISNKAVDVVTYKTTGEIEYKKIAVATGESMYSITL